MRMKLQINFPNRLCMFYFCCVESWFCQEKIFVIITFSTGSNCLQSSAEQTPSRQAARGRKLFYKVELKSFSFPAAHACSAVKCWRSHLQHLSEHAQETPQLQVGRAVQRTAQTTHRRQGMLLHRPGWFALWSRPGVPAIRPAAHREHPGGLMLCFIYI